MYDERVLSIGRRQFLANAAKIGALAALRLARDAGLQPNAVTKQHFDELAPHFDQGQMVELVAIISLFGFLNRWNETIATDLEDKAFEFASRHLHEAGWEPGRHRPERPG